MSLYRSTSASTDLKTDEFYDGLVEVAYWRKFNALHKWFVDNLQGGVDDCSYYEVKKQHLNDLFELLTKVNSLNPKYTGIPVNEEELEQLLPTQPGFFFGGISYDERYFYDVDNAITQVKNLLDIGEFENLYYNSSW